MPVAPEQLAPAALIVGCGYVGRRVAKLLLNMGIKVYATSRSEAKAAALAQLGARPLLLDVTQPLTFASIRPAIEEPLLDVYHLVPPGRTGNDPSPHKVVVDGTAHMVRNLERAVVRRGVYASSTAVYGQTDGSTVDADSDPQAPGPRGQLLLEGEQLWLAPGDTRHVVRFAGLYGPGRVIGMSAVREGAPIVGNPDALLNLIHADDAAQLLVHTAASASAAPIELGCDDQPLTRVAYYHALADRLGCPRPAVLDDDSAALQLGLNAERLRRASSKRCDNAATRRRTGWSPQYATIAQGLNAVLGEMPNESRTSESPR